MNERLIPWDDLTEKQRAQWKKLSKESEQDPFVGGEWFKKSFGGEEAIAQLKNKPTCIFKDEDLCGFINPYLETTRSGNIWRSGVIYLMKAHRGQGIMRRILHEFFLTHYPAHAWINGDNSFSISLYLSLGFKLYKIYDNGKWHHYKLEGKPRSLDKKSPIVRWY
jgi:GNAT superfamily N-acetyltransferase